MVIVSPTTQRCAPVEYREREAITQTRHEYHKDEIKLFPYLGDRRITMALLSIY